MPLYYCPRVLFQKWFPLNGAERHKKKKNIIAIGGQEKKGDFEGEVYKKQETFEPCIYIFLRRINNQRPRLLEKKF